MPENNGTRYELMRNRELCEFDFIEVENSFSSKDAAISAWLEECSGHLQEDPHLYFEEVIDILCSFKQALRERGGFFMEVGCAAGPGSYDAIRLVEVPAVETVPTAQELESLGIFRDEYESEDDLRRAVRVAKLEKGEENNPLPEA